MSHQLHCPTCTTAIPPENINVQKMIAVCAECGAVFNFEDKISTTKKVKRRKTRKPDYMTLTETEDSITLEKPLIQTKAYRAMTLVGALVMLVLYMAIMNDVITDATTNMVGKALFMSGLFLPMTLFSFAALFMKESVEVTHEHLKHIVHLGMPIYQRSMDAGDIVDINIEETTLTRESTAAARYNLYADKIDNRQEMFLNNLPEDSALYTQQVLSNYFKNEDIAIDRLSIQDDEHATENLDLYHDEEQSLTQKQGM